MSVSICCEFHACLEACVTFSKPRAGEGGTFVRTILEIPKKVVENRVFASPCPFSGTRFWTTFWTLFWTFFSKLANLLALRATRSRAVVYSLYRMEVPTSNWPSSELRPSWKLRLHIWAFQRRFFFFLKCSFKKFNFWSTFFDFEKVKVWVEHFNSLPKETVTVMVRR